MKNNFSETLLQEGIKSKQSIPEVLFYLDITERDIKKVIEIINDSTKPKIMTIGEYSPKQIGETEWEDKYYFNYPLDKNDIIGFYYGSDKICTEEQAKIEAEEHNRLSVLSEDKHNKYLEKYSEEIIEIKRLYSLVNIIKNERDYYEKQFIKYGRQTKGSEEPTVKLNWLGTFTDFAFLIDRLIKKGFLRKGYKDILSHFYIDGDEKNERQLADLISKINNRYSDRKISPELISLIEADNK